METKQIAERYFERLKAKDVKSIAAMLSRDVTMVGPMQTHHGREDVIGTFNWMLPILEGVEIHRLAVDGDTAIAAWTFVGTRPIGAVRMCEVLTVEAGLISHIEAYYDTSQFAAVGTSRVELLVA